MFFTINNGILDNSSILCTPIGCCSIDDRRYWKTLGSLLATLMTQMTLSKKKAKKKVAIWSNNLRFWQNPIFKVWLINWEYQDDIWTCFYISSAEETLFIHTRHVKSFNNIISTWHRGPTKRIKVNSKRKYYSYMEYKVWSPGVLLTWNPFLTNKVI